MADNWFPFYPERFLSSRKVRRMDATEIGIYIALLIEEWLEGGAVPDDDRELEIIGRAPISEVRRVLDLCFILTEDGWANEPLEEIRQEQLAKLERARNSGRKGAQARWGKRKRKKDPKWQPHSDPIAPPLAPPIGGHNDPNGTSDEQAKQAKPQNQEPQELNSDPIGCLCDPNGIEKRVEERRVRGKGVNTPSPNGESVCVEGEQIELDGSVALVQQDPEVWMHALWEQVFGVEGHPVRLTDDRKTKYRRMYVEQLHDTPDPRIAWEAVLRTVSRSPHHRANRAYLMPESFLRNEERRDRWVLQTIDMLKNGGTVADREFAAKAKDIADYLRERAAT